MSWRELLDWVPTLLVLALVAWAVLGYYQQVNWIAEVLQTTVAR